MTDTSDILLVDRRHLMDEKAPTIYGPRIPWEIPVQLCLSDFVRKGDLVFDVGANIGAVSIALARIVGPKGEVHAFEANPEACAWIERDLSANGVDNVRVVCKGVWKSSGERLPFFVDDSYYAGASGFHRADRGWRSIPVETLSLDDYVSLTGALPSAVKIDVERSEFEVIQGSQDLIRRRRPFLVFEYFPGVSPDRDPAELVRSLGYDLYDANLYLEVSRRFYHEHFSPVPLSNILAVPASCSASQYRRIELVEEEKVATNGERETGFFALKRPGRFRIDARFDGPETATATLRLVTDDRETLAYCTAPLPQLREPACSSLIVEVQSPCRVKCEIDCEDASRVRLDSVVVLRIDGLPARRP